MSINFERRVDGGIKKENEHSSLFLILIHKKEQLLFIRNILNHN